MRACPAAHSALQVQEMMLGGLDSSVLDKIAKIMSYMTVQGEWGSRSHNPLALSLSVGHRRCQAMGNWLCARRSCFDGLHVPAPWLCCLPTGGGKKKLKRREREALLQQHGIQVHGQLKNQAAPAAAAAAAVEEENAGEQQRPAARQAAAPVDEDDDIFGDAGTDYQPTVKDKQRAAAAAAAAAVAEQRRGGYFGQQEDVHADLPPLPRDGE